MLKKKDILDRIDNKYWEMIDQLDIGNLYKCLAQFSGLKPNELQDDVIYKMIETWAKNKYRFFVMLGNKLSVDVNFSYNKVRTDIEDEVLDLSKQYLIYRPWLAYFNNCSSNNIDIRNLRYSAINDLKDIFPNVDFCNMKITHFFKKYLSAPEELVTAIGKIFENDKVNTQYAISIDPVDMMLASETPYDWNSCYRLELDRCDSHADGCAAAMLDTKSLITYLWTSKGKYVLCNNYDFKEIKYKRMRAWIAISDDFNIIHFNDIYPKKNELSEDFEKAYRNVVETLVANYLDTENIWKPAHSIVDCHRKYDYGYSEYYDKYCYGLKSYVNPMEDDEKGTELVVFDEQVPSLDGDGMLPPSNDDENEYNGSGFLTSNYENRYWCDYADDYCECGCHGNDYECENMDCPYWQEAHPVCELNHSVRCPDPGYNIYDGVQAVSTEHCCNCEYYQHCHPLCHIDEDTECTDPDIDCVCDGVQSENEKCMNCPKWKKEYGDEEEENTEIEEKTIEEEKDDEETIKAVCTDDTFTSYVASNTLWTLDSDEVVSTVYEDNVTTLFNEALNQNEEEKKILDYVKSHPEILEKMREEENNEQG